MGVGWGGGFGRFWGDVRTTSAAACMLFIFLYTESKFAQLFGVLGHPQVGFFAQPKVDLWGWCWAITTAAALG